MSSVPARLVTAAPTSMLSVIASKMGTAKHPVNRNAVANSAQCQPAGFSENMSPEPAHVFSTRKGSGKRAVGTRVISGNLARHELGHLGRRVRAHAAVLGLTGTCGRAILVPLSPDYPWCAHQLLPNAKHERICRNMEHATAALVSRSFQMVSMCATAALALLCAFRERGQLAE